LLLPLVAAAADALLLLRVPPPLELDMMMANGFRTEYGDSFGGDGGWNGSNKGAGG
jgi:hypothetical protein